MGSSWQSVFADLRSRWRPAGLDLAQPFRVDWYNEAVADPFRLPDFGRSSALGILVGNTRALWPRFLEALRAERPLLDDQHPLDRYVERSVRAVLAPLAHRFEARFAHEQPPRRVAMQRLAQISGLAELTPGHLSVHATYGPWIALRAAVVIDFEGPSGAPPEAPNPCPDCERHCLPRFREAIAAAGTMPVGHGAIERHWRLWLAVRDACPVGRSHRYGALQIRYHYTKDREILRRVLSAEKVSPLRRGRFERGLITHQEQARDGFHPTPRARNAAPWPGVSPSRW